MSVFFISKEISWAQVSKSFLNTANKYKTQIDNRLAVHFKYYLEKDACMAMATCGLTDLVEICVVMSTFLKSKTHFYQ